MGGIGGRATAYEVECEMQGLASDERLRIRQLTTRPIAEALNKWLAVVSRAVCTRLPMRTSKVLERLRTQPASRAMSRCHIVGGHPQAGHVANNRPRPCVRAGSATEKNGINEKGPGVPGLLNVADGSAGNRRFELPRQRPWASRTSAHERSRLTPALSPR